MSITTRANRALFWIVVVWLAIAPIPLGSDRPFFWAINGMIGGAAALAYIAMLRGDFSRLRGSPGAAGAAGLLFAAAIVWLLIQIAPMPARWLALPVWVEASRALGQNLSASISSDRAATIGMIIRFATYCLMFLLTLQFTINPSRARRLLKAVFWITVVHGAIAILMLLALGDKFLLVFPKWAYQGDATGFFVNRNSFATFLAFGISIGTLLVVDQYIRYNPRDSEGRKDRSFFDFISALFIYGAGLAILATAIVLSTSRMGAFVAGLGVWVVFAVAFFRSPEKRRGIIIVFVVAMGIASVILLVSGSGLADRIGSVENNADDRLILYRQVLDMIVTRPWIGYGGGGFSEIFPTFHRLPLSADVTWDAAHNTYLELFADLGFGAVLPLLALLIVIVRMVHALVRARVDWIAPAAAVAVAVVAAVHSLVDFSLQIEANALVFACILGAGSGQALGRRRKERDELQRKSYQPYGAGAATPARLTIYRHQHSGGA